MPCASHAWLTAQRRRSGLRSFPRRCPSTPASPDSTPTPDASASRSPAPTPSAVVPGPPSTRRTPCATGCTSARQSPLLYTPAATSCRSRHPPQPAVTGSQSVPHYASSLVPFQAPLIPVCLISTGTRNAGHSSPKRLYLTSFQVRLRAHRERPHGLLG